MPLAIPPAVNYPSPLIALPSASQDEPTEGRKQVTLEVLWGTMGGSAKCIAVNLQNNAALAITQISTLKIDNSQSGADVTFIFPDTLETIVIPANTPLSIAPVFSNSTQFFVSASGAASVDITRFIILNYAIDPDSVDPTQALSLAFTSSPVWDNTLPTISTQLVAPGISGTIRYFQLGLCMKTNFGAALPLGQFSLRDGQGNLPIKNLLVAGGSTYTPYTMQNVQFRFINGLYSDFSALGNWTGSEFANFTITYTQP